MCLCGVVLSGIFLQKHCWNFFILFVKERQTWMVRNSPLLGRYLWHWALPRGSVNNLFWVQFPGGVGQERHLSVYPHFALTVFTITHFTCCLWQIGEGSMDDVKGKIFLDDSYNTVPAVCRHLFDLKLLPTSSSLITLLWSFWALVQTM